MNTNLPVAIQECIEQGIDALRFKARHRMDQWNRHINEDPKNVNSDYGLELNNQVEECYNAAQVLEGFLRGNKNES